MTGEKTLATRRVEVERNVIAAWLNDPGFRVQWHPDATLFLSPDTRTIANVAAEMGPKLTGANYLLELHARGLIARAGGMDVVSAFGRWPTVPEPHAALDDLRRVVAAQVFIHEATRLMAEMDHGRIDISSGFDAIQDAVQKALSSRDTPVHFEDELLQKVLLNAVTPPPQHQAPVTSGVHMFQQMVGGYQRGHVVLVGAETSWGKSSWAIAEAEEALTKGWRILIVSGEDAPHLYGQRIMARRARVNATRLRDGKLRPDELQRVTDAAALAQHRPMILNGIGRPAEDVAAEARTLAVRHKIDLVIVDYVQAFNTRINNGIRRDTVMRAGEAFTNAIKQTGAAGMLLSQLTSPDSRGTEGRPTKHQIRDARDLAHRAEAIVLGYMVEGARMMRVEKGKNGSLGDFELKWDGESACFLPIDARDAHNYGGKYEPQDDWAEDDEVAFGDSYN